MLQVACTLYVYLLQFEIILVYLRIYYECAAFFINISTFMVLLSAQLHPIDMQVLDKNFNR